MPLGYLLLAIAASWPLARDFATYTAGEVHYDERHAIWVLWHTLQALTGQAAWPHTTQLFSPHGVSVLLDGVGPVNGLLALPFWPWGAAAAYNGAALLGLTLSGWCLYALGRDIGLGRGPAFVAGALYLLWPIHLIALLGHLEKLFLGLLPLTLLAGRRAFDPARRPAWLVAPGVALLATLLQNGNQFVFAALGLGLVGLGVAFRAPLDRRRAVLVRLAAITALSLLVCGPMLAAIVSTMRHPWMLVALGDMSSRYAPDLAQLVAPAPHQLVAAPLYPDDTPHRDFARASTIPALSPGPTWYGSGPETAVNVPLVALGLAVAGVVLRARGAAGWMTFGMAFAALALGPWLRAFGYTWPALKIPLPYALLMLVPGLNVMRVPGRLMMMGSVGFVLAAALGSAALRQRGSRSTRLVLAGVLVLAIVECWPRPWPQSALPPVPRFYVDLAREPGAFAVLDLPHGWHDRSDYASAYQYFQTWHRKPIAWAYLSRYYTRFPVEGLDSLWNANLTDHRATRSRLRALGYRYVVWHKHPELFEGGRVADGADGTPRAEPTPARTNAFIREAFRGETPLRDDDLTTVFEVR